MRAPSICTLPIRSAARHRNLLLELQSGRTKIAESVIPSLPVHASAVNLLAILDAILVGLVAALFANPMANK
jgi:hypothetical protein